MTGNDFERELVKILADEFGLISFNNKNRKEAQIGRSSHFAPYLDDCKIDIWIKEGVDTILHDFAFQAKKRIEYRKTTESIQPEILNEIESDAIPVLVNRIVRRPKRKEIEVGTFVTLKLEDFIGLLKRLEHAELAEPSIEQEEV
jgi:hypothetical protein